MTDVIPRWYQIEAVNSLFNYFERANGNPLIAMPTGTGKSLVTAGFVYSVLSIYPNQRILILTHVKELIVNNYKALIKIWPTAPAGIYSAGLGRKDLFAPITFGGVSSVINIIDIIGHIDLLMIDECHLLGSSADGEYMRIITALKTINPYIKVIGLTATAWRTGMGLLTNGEIFTDVCYDLCTMAGFKRLFAEGFLVPPIPKRTDFEIDLSSVKIVNGDFSQVGQQKAATADITWNALNESLNKNPDRKCRLAFCSGVDHAILTAEMARHIGLRAQAVHSKMPDNERDDIFRMFFAGDLDMLTNNGIATTGIDHPPIDHEIMLRGTASVGLWVQMVGRGMRPYEGKTNCIVSDHGGNARRLGPIDDPYIPKMKGKTSGDLPVKICPACDTYNHISARTCINCGQPFEFKIGYTPKASDEQIIRSDLPQFEEFKVLFCFYTRYMKRDAPPGSKPTLKATYQCELRQFNEFIPFESEAQFNKHRSREWWRQRFPEEGYIPITVEDALKHVHKLIPPKTIKVHVNKQYPEVVGYGY